MSVLHVVSGGMVIIAEAIVLLRALLRPHREPASRLAWVIIIVVAPVIGAIAYLLLGETRVRRRRTGAAIDRQLLRPPDQDAAIAALKQGDHWAPFALARTVNGLGPTATNSASLAADSNAAIDGIVDDIDAAQKHVHVCTYIWLKDRNGRKVKDALVRAAVRGVAVRVLADALGSRRFIHSRHWRDLRRSGVHARPALPLGSIIRMFIRGRLDLRNHRKAVVIDNRVAWCGSQNLADPAFRIKPRYAPWVDVMTRWEGPVASHCQLLFVSDWMGDGGNDISDCLAEQLPSVPPDKGTVIAQVIGTGPTLPYDAMPTCICEIIHSARHELVVTTPYFVPDEQLLYALVAAARRGVDTSLVFPRRNDSRFVAGASRSYYSDLVKAGARIFEFRPGLLHAKTMVVDRKIGLIGSANLDRRSFELNFENNILFSDPAFAGTIRERQVEFIAQSDAITPDDVASFSLARRIWQNALGMLSPLL